MKRFTSIRNLEGIRRTLWRRLFEKYKPTMEAAGIEPPDDSLSDEKYVEALKEMFLAPKELPGELTDLLYAVADLGNEYAEDRLRRAAQEKNLPLVLDDESTCLEVAMEIGLLDEVLLFTKHDEQKLVAVSSFRHYGAKVAPESRLPFHPPGEEARVALEKALDDMFAARQRGRNTVRVKCHVLDGEYWYVIEHGGNFRRQTTTDNGLREILHFRPGEDDLLVYNVEMDEIRIHTITQWQRKLYQREFGKFLRSDYDYFGAEKAFTLSALRKDLESALSTEGIVGLEEIRLVEVQLDLGGEYGDVEIYRSKDMVASARDRGERIGKIIPAFPDHGRLVRATVEIDFMGAKKPRRVHLSLPNGLNVGRNCDVRLIHHWLSKRGFRTAHMEEMEMPPRSVQPVSEMEPAVLPTSGDGRPRPEQN